MASGVTSHLQPSWAPVQAPHCRAHLTLVALPEVSTVSAAFAGETWTAPEPHGPCLWPLGHFSPNFQNYTSPTWVRGSWRKRVLRPEAHFLRGQAQRCYLPLFPPSPQTTGTLWSPLAIDPNPDPSNALTCSALGDRPALSFRSPSGASIFPAERGPRWPRQAPPGPPAPALQSLKIKPVVSEHKEVEASGGSGQGRQC